jgi:hypothetical protein
LYEKPRPREWKTKWPVAAAHQLDREANPAGRGRLFHLAPEEVVGQVEGAILACLRIADTV